MELKNKIAFVGKMHSGKTTAVEIFSKIASEHIKIPEIIKFAYPLYESQKHFKLGKHRIFLQSLSDLAKQCFGKQILSVIFKQRLKMLIKLNKKQDFIYLCDDVRVTTDFETVKKLGFYIIGIKCKDSTRKARNPDLFVGTQHKTEASIDKIIDKVDHIIYNEDSLDKFKSTLRDICMQVLNFKQLENLI